MKANLVVESDGNGGLFAFLEETPIVTYGETMDDIMSNILSAVDEYNNANPEDENIEIGELSFNYIDDEED